jgi:hypothetical protein
MTDPAAALAAIMARLNRYIGQPCTVPTRKGGRVTGTLSGYELREIDGSVWVTFREHGRPVEATGYPESAKTLPSQPAQIEEKGQQ